jgi:DNA-binding transcriptional LysR family regulator
MDLQLAHVKTLEAVARHGSFSRAAAELHLTQPAVSMHVRQLEGHLGLPLLDRLGKRAFPTRAGEVLLAHAARALGELEAGVAMVQRLRGIVAGRVRIGTSASISIYLLPPVLRRVRARHPDVELVVVTGNAPEIARAVVANALDLGIVSLPVRDRELTVLPFYRDELVAIAPPQPAWRKRRTIGAAELAREPLILFEQGSTQRRVVESWFHRAGISPAHAMELGNTEAIKQLVGAGLGLSLGSWFAVRGDARAGRLVALRLVPRLVHQRGIVLRKDKPRAPALAAVLDALAAATRTPSPAS